jgi:hypothetical protein
MDPDQIDLLETLTAEVKALRSELNGKVDVSTLERIDKVIEELECCPIESVNFRNVLILLGIVIEHLPSVIKAIDSLVQK